MAAILIIEDDEKSRRLLVDVLGFHGYHILQAERAEDGLELLASERVVLVLMDIQLPGMSGFAALASIRAAEMLRQTKVVAVTASVMDHDRKKILAAGLDACLVQPVDLVELL